MKHVKRLLVLSIVLAGVVETADAADPLSGFRPYLIGISVPNAQEAATWYEKQLGFKREGGDRSSRSRVSIVEDGPGIAVELLQLEGSLSIRRLNPDFDIASGKLQGIRKMGFAVDNVEDALSDLKRKGVRVVQAMTELKSFNVKYFLIEDNNGNLIQIFQNKMSHPAAEAP